MKTTALETSAVVSVRADGASRIGHYRQRTLQVAPHACRLVEREMSMGISPVRIVLTDSRGLDQVADRAHLDLAAAGESPTLRARLDAWDSLISSSDTSARDTLGQVVVDARGIVMLLNTSAIRGRRELDETIVHEFVHCAQFSVPKFLAAHRRYFRMMYNVEPRDAAHRTAYMRQVSTHEDEAESLERLARQLPPQGTDNQES